MVGLWRPGSRFTTTWTKYRAGFCASCDADDLVILITGKLEDVISGLMQNAL